MAINPSIQERAQKEIDRVVGRNRLPDFSDRPNMPYLEAIYREVLRSRPPLTMGFPHCLMEDDHYKGYSIPKGWLLFFNTLDYCSQEFLHPMIIGATVIGNVWQVFLTRLFHENWRKCQGPWHMTQVYTLNLLSSNLKDSLTKTESSTTMTGYWRIVSGGGTFLLLPFKSILTITQSLRWTARCKRNCRYS